MHALRGTVVGIDAGERKAMIFAGTILAAAHVAQVMLGHFD